MIRLALVNSRDLLSPSQKKRLKGIDISEGACYYSAEAAFYLLGGRDAGWEAYVLPKQVLGDNTHWWIENKFTKERVDPTAKQFGDIPIPYERGKKCGFLTNTPSKRCRILMERIDAKRV